MENNYKPFSEDIRFHLIQIKMDLLNCIIDNSKNSSLSYSLNFIKDKIELCEHIIKKYDNHNFRLLADIINENLKRNPEIHFINVLIIVKKYSSSLDYSKQIKLNFPI